MCVRKTKKAANRFLKEILDNYELEQWQLTEMKILLYEFVQIMTPKEVRETLKDYHLHI